MGVLAKLVVQFAAVVVEQVLVLGPLNNQEKNNTVTFAKIDSFEDKLYFTVTEK